jgi:hypothetical protein
MERNDVNKSKLDQAVGGALMGCLLLLAPGVGLGQDSFPTCPDPRDLIEAHTLLRALSLDLRGVVPSPEEYARIDEDGSIPEALIDEWMVSDEFADQVVRHHESLLWPNVSDVRLMSNRSRLIRSNEIWYRYLVAPLYRGGPVYCGDFEAQFGPDGELITTTDANGYVQEGWVWMDPYWDPGNLIKVCAFEAQPDLVSPWGTPCDGYDGRYDPHCGCGPNLAWCDTSASPPTGDWSPVQDSMAGDLNRRVFRVIDEDLPYTELLTGRTAFVNGPLVHFYKYQTQIPAHVRYNEMPVDPALLPDLQYDDEDTWVPIQLGEEQSGVLTSPLFLTKYQTNRARSNRFYNAFLCQPFQPPEDGLPGLAEGDATLDLSQRAGCKYCHTILEPASAYWGRWAQYGAGYLDPETFPPYNPDCEWCAVSGSSCSPECSRYYVLDPLASEEDPYVGWLQSYEFLGQQHHANIEEGPRMLVQRGLVDGRLPNCVSRNAAAWLLGRDLAPEEAVWVEELALAFTNSGYNYKALIKAIIDSDHYRRVQ